MDRWVNGWMDRLKDGKMDEYEWTDEQMDGWMMEEWMDGWVDGWMMDRWMDGKETE